MPHLTLEYSANLEAAADLPALCDELRRALLATGLCETGAVRVRALRAAAWSIADGDARNAFLDMVLRVGAGRSPADRRRMGEALVAAATARLAPLLAAPHFALSLEVREIDPALSWRKNSMHARFRPAGETP